MKNLIGHGRFLGYKHLMSLFTIYWGHFQNIQAAVLL